MRRKLARWTLVTLVAACTALPLCGCKTFGGSSSSGPSSRWFAWGKKKSDRPAALAQNTQPKTNYPPPVVPQQSTVVGGGYPSTNTPGTTWTPPTNNGANPYNGYTPNPYNGTGANNVVSQPNTGYPVVGGNSAYPTGGGSAYPTGGGSAYPTSNPYISPPTTNYGPHGSNDPRTATNPYPSISGGGTSAPSTYTPSGYPSGGYNSSATTPGYDNRSYANNATGAPDASHATPPRYDAASPSGGYVAPASNTGDTGGYRPGSTNAGFPTQPAGYDTNYAPGANGGSYPPAYAPPSSGTGGYPTRTY